MRLRVTLVRWTDQAADDLFPLSGRIVPELGREDVREIILGEYRIVHRLEGETALIELISTLPEAGTPDEIVRWPILPWHRVRRQLEV